MSEKSQVAIINEEINRQLTTETAGALLATTFKGLTAPLMKQALMEGMLRGFTFENFVKKDIYALPFAGGYSLITSIDYSRKIGARSGVVGVDKPEYEVDPVTEKIISCTVTVKKKVGEYIGDYSATAYFTEYYKGGGKYPSLWDTKPRTMIAKVAEMHALRKACPEEVGQIYIEEEIEETTPSRMKEVENLVENNPISMGNFKQKNEEKDIEVESAGGLFDQSQEGK